MCPEAFLVLTREKTGSWDEIGWWQQPQRIQQTSHSCYNNSKTINLCHESKNKFRLGARNVWANFKRSDVKSSAQSVEGTLDARPLPAHQLRWRRQERSAKVLAPVVQNVDKGIRWLNLYVVDNAISFPITPTHWIVIYPVDSSIHRLNNQSLVGERLFLSLRLATRFRGFQWEKTSVTLCG